MTALCQSLPDVLPLFPLSGALLLPHGSLPLHIFEPRYVAMVEDANAGGGIIGMIQPADADNRSARPPLYTIGCAGRIAERGTDGDGRRFLTLTGVSRFDLLDERPPRRGYRRAAVSYTRFGTDRGPEAQDGVETAPLMRALRRYCAARGVEADWGEMQGLPPAVLVNLLAMMCPFQPAEKQALLEALTLRKRAHILAMLLELDAPGAGAAGAHVVQ